MIELSRQQLVEMGIISQGGILLPGSEIFRETLKTLPPGWKDLKTNGNSIQFYQRADDDVLTPLDSSNFSSNLFEEIYHDHRCYG